jgi:rhamnulose-1-phosphate aldolase/alcohol dehydrogenase
MTNQAVADLIGRSNRLGSDPKNTNYAGGNTSAKGREVDPVTGEEIELVWVKGSGGDLGTLKESGLAVLRLDRMQQLVGVYPGVEREDEMVAAFDYCLHGKGGAAPSIDTAMHGLVDATHVDHLHPDSGIAIATAADGEELTAKIFGDKVVWVPWRRPGFQLGLDIAKIKSENSQAKGCILGGHGVTAWGNTSEEAEANSLWIIDTAAAYIADNSKPEPFGALLDGYGPLPDAERRAKAAALAPTLRSVASYDNPMVGNFNDDARVLDFLARAEHPRLAELGTSCPDHFLRTKIRPLIVDFDPTNPDVDAIVAGLDKALEGYRADYARYYNDCKHDNSPAMRDANPVIFLVPGVGMLSFARDKATARIASEFYVNAINVMRGASTVSEYQGLPEQEAFDIEYWLLEEAKLQRMPKPKSLAGKVAFVTGGAGGIGRATAARLIGEGACVVLADIDQAALDSTQADFAKQFGADAVRSVKLDVTKEDAVISSFAEACVEFGGVDILVSNAGIASSAPIESTELSMWNKNIDILATGYFLVSREAFRLFRKQNLGGNVVFVASKNGLASSPNAAAYCTAKAAEIHLARCLALEGAEAGIRVNTVNPDAVLRGSKIWSGEWREQRAASSKIEINELEEHYRKRSMLKLNVFPEDIAEAIYFLASDLSAKSTGNIINVDAGNAQSFPR